MFQIFQRKYLADLSRFFTKFTRETRIICTIPHVLCVFVGPLTLGAHRRDARHAFTDRANSYIILLPLYVARSGKSFDVLLQQRRECCSGYCIHQCSCSWPLMKGFRRLLRWVQHQLLPSYCSYVFQGSDRYYVHTS